MKLRPFRWILPILFIALFSGQRPASEERVALEKVSRELKSIWPPDECAAYITRNSGFPMVSLACVGNFSKTERALSLDVLFKTGFALKDESYQLNPDSGLYLYKTEHPIGSGNYVFFKFYFTVRNPSFIIRFFWSNFFISISIKKPQLKLIPDFHTF